MSESVNEAVSGAEATELARAELEREVWRLTGWRGEAALVDQLLAAADRYALAVGHRLVRAATGGDDTPLAGVVAVPLLADPILLGDDGGVATVSRRVAQPAVVAGWAVQVCGGCQLELPADQFSRDRSRKSGLRWRCRKCDKAQRESARERAAATAS